MKHFVKTLVAFNYMTLDKEINKDLEMREQNGWLLETIVPLTNKSVLLIYVK